jgi:hypothetical protein
VCSTHYPYSGIQWRLDRPPCRSGLRGEKSLLSLQGTEPQFLSHLYWLRYPNSVSFFKGKRRMDTALIIHTPIVFLFYLDGLGSLACSHSELLWNYESHWQLVGLHRRGISPSQGRYLHRATQTQKADIHVSGGIRTNNLIIWKRVHYDRYTRIFPRK